MHALYVIAALLLGYAVLQYVFHVTAESDLRAFRRRDASSGQGTPDDDDWKE